MSLKYEVTEVPAELAQFYTQTESGAYRLNVEGAVPASEFETVKAKNKEFRDTNTNLLKTNKALSGFSEIFGGIDKVTPEVLESKIEAMAAKRAEEMVTSMKSKYDEEVNELRSGWSQASTQLAELKLGDAVQKAGNQHGVLNSAFDDVMLRAKNAFEYKDGDLVYKGKELDAEGKPYTVQTWMSELSTKATHLFAQSQGTGAARNAKTSAINTHSGQKRSADALLSSGLSKLTGSSVKRLS